MYISKYSAKYGVGDYIGVMKSTLFTKIEVLADRWVKNKPYGENTMTDLMISSLASSVKRRVV